MFRFFSVSTCTDPAVVISQLEEYLSPQSGLFGPTD